MAINFVQTAVGALMVVGGAASLRGTKKEEEVQKTPQVIEDTRSKIQIYNDALRDGDVSKSTWKEILSGMDQAFAEIDQVYLTSFGAFLNAQLTDMEPWAPAEQSEIEKFARQVNKDLPVTADNEWVIAPQSWESATIECGGIFEWDVETRLNLAYARIFDYYDLWRQGWARRLGFSNLQSMFGYAVDDAIVGTVGDYQRFLSAWQLLKKAIAELPSSDMGAGFEIGLGNYRDFASYTINLDDLIAATQRQVNSAFVSGMALQLQRAVLGQSNFVCMNKDAIRYPAANVIVSGTGGISEIGVNSLNGAIQNLVLKGQAMEESYWSYFFDQITQYAQQFTEFVVNVVVSALTATNLQSAGALAAQTEKHGRKIVGAGLIVGGSVVMIGGLRS